MPDPFLELLSDDLAAIPFVAGTPTAARDGELLERCQRMLAIKLRFEAERPDDAPPLVVIAGGTNVGKSTVFNWVVGDAVASASPLARHTKAPTVYVHEAELAALASGAFLPRYRRLTLEAPSDPTEEARAEDAGSYFLLTHERSDVQGVVLVDSPDIDSTHDRNRRVAEDLLYLADAVLFVATPEKYNDELCVRYLRQACELLKSLTCVMNKGADAEVARDFEERVLPSLGSTPAILSLPYVSGGPDPASKNRWRTELQQAVLLPGEERTALRQASLRGAQHLLGSNVESLVSRLREELSELDRIRSEVELALDVRRDDYARFLDGLEFYELDRVFERVLEYFKIPVIDTVYTGFRSAIGFVTSNLGRLVNGRPPEDAKAAALAARADADRLKAKELLEETRAAVLGLPERYSVSLREAAQSWVEGLESPGVEEVNAQVDRFLEQAEAEAERWIEEQTRQHVELLEQHPYARAALRTLKGTTQIGIGLLSAKLTGGFGPWDLLIGTATERGVKKILEAAGGYVHYQSLRSGFAQTRAELFRNLLAETVATPLVERLPAGVDPERLDRLVGAAEVLRRRAAALGTSTSTPRPEPTPATSAEVGS